MVNFLIFFAFILKLMLLSQITFRAGTHLLLVFEKGSTHELSMKQLNCHKIFMVTLTDDTMSSLEFRSDVIVVWNCSVAVVVSGDHELPQHVTVPQSKLSEA